MNLAKRIYYARFGIESSAQLSNPLIKLVVLLCPGVLFVFQTAARTLDFARLGVKELIIASLMLYLCANVALSGSKFPRFVRRSIGFLSLIVLFLLATSHPPDPLKRVAELASHTFGRIHALSGVTLETWVLLSLLAPMHSAARNITTRDALWIGRTFLWRGPAFVVYTVVIVVHAVLGSVLPLRLTSAWQSAVSKAKLARNSSLTRRRSFIKNTAGTFATNLIGNNAAIGLSIASLIKQRGMFRRGQGDPAAGNLSPEDRMALLLLIILLLLFILYRMPLAEAAH